MEDNNRNQDRNRNTAEDNNRNANEGSERNTQQSSSESKQSESDMDRSTHETKIGERGTSGLGNQSQGTTTMRSASDQTQTLNDSGSLGRTKKSNSTGRSGRDQGNNLL